jgi:RHS repeat-associated protein
MVSKIDPACPSPLVNTANFETTYTETRGDGPTRTFTYTELHLTRSHGEPEACPVAFLGPAPQQFLQSYTDFQNHTTQLGYDGNWYVNSVTDANGHTTTYTRGPRPPNGIGEILTIQQPGDNSTINYVYTDNGHYLTQITDERGNKTIHIRDPNTHLISSTQHWDANNNLLAYEEFSYNSFGQVKTHHLPSNSGWSGPYIHFKYDDNNRGLLVAKTNPTTIADWNDALNQAPKTTYTYYTAADGKPGWIDRVKIMTLPANVSGNAATETYEYDVSANNTSRGLVTKIQHADLKYQSFGYDVYANKLWEENELRKRTSYTYDEYNRVLTVKDPVGQTTGRTTTYTYNPTNGTGNRLSHTTSNPDMIITPRGIQTSNVYDENFRKESTTVGASTTRFGYDDVGNPTTVTDPLIHTTTTDYDNRNRKWHVWDALGHRSIFGYDPTSNVISITRPDNRIETKAYDGMNRLIRHTVPKSGTESLTTTFGYWPSGKLFWVKDPKQQGTTLATFFAYNESDQMIAMYYPDPTLTTLQQWSYDDAHNLASRTTVGGKTQSFTYDIRNRKTGMSWSNGADPDWANFTYWDDARLKTAQNPNSTVYREYDAAGRLKLDRQDVNGVGTAVDVNHDYDDDGKENHLWAPYLSYDYTFDYDTMGRFETIKPTGGNIAFRYYYDAASNEIHRDNLLNGGVTQIYNRDNLNRIWRLDVKKGAVLLGREDYGYDAMNRLASVTREDNRQDQFAYWFDGELAVATYGANPTPTPSPPPSPTPTPPGGQVAEPSFNPPGRNIYPAGSVTVAISTATTGAQIRHTLDGGTHWTTIQNGGSVTFSPGLRGMTLTAIGFKSGMADSDPHSEDYWREDPGGGEAPDTYRTVVYYLDGAGNRTAVADSLLGNATYAPNDLNQYTAVTNSTITNGSEHEVRTYQGPYDAQPATYMYINDEHLKQVSNGTDNYYLYYDALGRCVKRTLNNFTTVYLYDGEKPILEYNQNGQTTRNVYGKGIDEILMRTDPTVNGGQPFYYQQDHEGSVTHLTNAIGNIVERYRYDVFGGPVIYAPNWTGRTTSSYNNRFLFTGREYAAASAAGYNAGFAFYEYRARAYNPSLGRFMSEDSKLADAGDYNLFRYCHNDPIDFTDPMGLEPPVAYSPRQESYLKALQHALSWPGHGAIQMGQVNFAIGQVQRTQSIFMLRAAAIEKYGAYDSSGRWANESRWITDYHVPKNIINDPNYHWRWAKESGGGLVTHFSVNRDLVAAVTAALNNLHQAGHLGDLHTFDGAFASRNTRGSGQVSAHAYGLALDINADMMPRGSRALQPLHLRTSFMRAGFVDGGTWVPPWAVRDPMHFTVGF